MLEWTLKCVTGTCYTEGTLRAAEVLRYADNTTMPFVPFGSDYFNGSFGRGNWLHKFLRNAGFCLATRK